MGGPDSITFRDKRELEYHMKAKEEIEERYCPRCKRRFAKLTLNNYLECMYIYKKINNKGKYRGIRCKRFKKIGPI